MLASRVTGSRGLQLPENDAHHVIHYITTAGPDASPRSGLASLSHRLFTASLGKSAKPAKPAPTSQTACIASHSHRQSRFPSFSLPLKEIVAGREFSLLARIIYSPVSWRSPSTATMDDENLVCCDCACASTPSRRRMIDIETNMNINIGIITHSVIVSPPGLNSVASPSTWSARNDLCHNQFAIRHPAAWKHCQQSHQRLSYELNRNQMPSLQRRILMTDHNC